MSSGRSTPTFTPVGLRSALIAGDQVSTSVLVHIDFADSFFEVPSFPVRSSRSPPVFRRDQHRSSRSPADIAGSVSCPNSENQEDQITVVTLRNVWRLSRENADDGNLREDDELLSAAPLTIPVQEFNPDCSSELVINNYY